VHRKLAFSTLAYDTLGIIPLVAGVVTTLCMSAKKFSLELIDYTTYVCVDIQGVPGGMCQSSGESYLS